jgi:hypothetical protein
LNLLYLVAVVEVQRYWNRFKQLGCSQIGLLSVKDIEESTEYDLFVKNVTFLENIIKFSTFQVDGLMRVIVDAIDR